MGYANRAAVASIESGHEDGVRHSAAAINFARAGDGKGAVRRHLMAAKAHQAAGVEALRNGDGAGSEMHHTAVGLHHKAASMHLESMGHDHDEDYQDQDEDDAMTSNAYDDPGDVLDLPETIFPSRPAGRGLTVNLRGAVEADDDCLPLPEPTLLYNYACDAEAARAVFNAQASQPKMHSWDGGVAGSVEKGASGSG
jgi:hypothetical protein